VLETMAVWIRFGLMCRQLVMVRMTSESNILTARNPVVSPT
jgi:hypothetical protein